MVIDQLLCSFTSMLFFLLLVFIPASLYAGANWSSAR